MDILKRHRALLDIVEDINETDIEDKEKFQAFADELCEAITNKVTLKKRLADPRETSEGIRNILNLIAVVPDSIKQMIWLKKLAFEYELNEGLLLKEFNIIKERKRKWAERKARHK